MSLTPKEFAEFESLLEGLCEDRLSNTDLARLEAWLLSDEAARRHYLQYIDLHGALYWDAAVSQVAASDQAVEGLVESTLLQLARPVVMDESDGLVTDHPKLSSRLVSSQSQLSAQSHGTRSDSRSESFSTAFSNTTGMIKAGVNPERRAVSDQLGRWSKLVGLSVAAGVFLAVGIFIGNHTARRGGVATQLANQSSPLTTPLSGAPGKSNKSAGSSYQVASNRAAQGAQTSTETPVSQKGGLKFSATDVQLPQQSLNKELSQNQEVQLANTPAGVAHENSVIPTPEIAALSEMSQNGATGEASHTITPIAGGSSGNGSASQIIGYINDQIRAGWLEAKITPSSRADDTEWLRRLHLDLTGHIPAAQDVERFLADRNPDKRSQEVEKLLDSGEFSQNFSTIWANLLVGRGPREEVNRPQLMAFLRQSFRRNRPWSEIVFDLMTAEGRTDQNGAVNFLVAHLNNGAIPATGITSRLFLGTQLQCVQCHNHPFNNSKQEQFWAFNSFFQQAVVVRNERVDAKTGRMIVAGIELAAKEADGPVFFETRHGLMKVAYPQFGGTRVDPGKHTSRRRELARLMTQSSESSLAPAFVNRMWAHFHGRAFTAAVDDLGSHSPPSHPRLLDRLSEEFTASGYDIKQLIRWICNSEPYQLTSRFTEGNAQDNPDAGEIPLFSHMYVKPLSPEQIYDSLMVASQGQVTDGRPEEADKARDQWMKQFVVSFDTEENDECSTLDGSITQSLLMINGDLIRNATSIDAGTWLHRQLAAKHSETERIQALFASALSRRPSTKEVAAVRKLVRNSVGNGRTHAVEAAYQDIYWALLNSNEFILNH